MPNTNTWILTATILASSMATIDASALNVALPVLQRSLQANAVQIVWVVNAYALTLAAFILAGGALGDVFGRKRIMLIGMAVFIGCSAACGAAPSIGWLIAARTVQGIGGALMIPGSLAIITAQFDAAERGKAIGTWSASGAIMVVGGPLLGGFLTDQGWWRAIFFVNIPLGLLAFFILVTKVPESRDPAATGQLDYGGAVLSAMGLAGLTYAFTNWSVLGVGNPLVWCTLLGGVACLAGFVWLEGRQKQPLVPLSLFRSATFSGTNLLTLFLYGALGVAPFFLSLNLVQVQGYRSSLAGLALMALPLPLILFSRWAGGLTDRFGVRLPLVIGPAVVGLGFLLLSFAGLTRGPSQYWTTFFPGILTLGIGLTFTVVPLTNAVMGAVKTDYAGTASAINNAVSRTAGVLFLAIAGSLAVSNFSHHLDNRTQSVSLSTPAKAALQAEASQLGAATPPAQISPAQRPAVTQAIHLAFTDTYQIILWGCTALAWLSALMAAFWLPKGKETAD